MSEQDTDTKECPFCAETIKAKAKKCKHCGEFMPGFSRADTLRQLGDSVRGDKMDIGDVKDAGGVAVGRQAQALQSGDIGGSLIQAQGDVTLGKDLREEQFRLALNWDGRSSLRSFDLSQRDLSEVVLAQADLRGADLSGANLYQADLRGAQLEKANLRGAKLNRANLGEAKLYKADLSGATIAFASLYKAFLMEANLSEARLIKTSLTEATLYQADVRRANLRGADLRGTDLTEVDLQGAIYDDDTKWPEGFVPQPAIDEL